MQGAKKSAVSYFFSSLIFNIKISLGFTVPVKAVNDCMMDCGKPVGAVKDVIGDEVNHFRAFLSKKIEKCSKATDTLPAGNFQWYSYGMTHTV